MVYRNNIKSALAIYKGFNLNLFCRRPRTDGHCSHTEEIRCEWPQSRHSVATGSSCDEGGWFTTQRLNCYHVLSDDSIGLLGKGWGPEELHSSGAHRRGSEVSWGPRWNCNGDIILFTLSSVHERQLN